MPLNKSENELPAKSEPSEPDDGSVASCSSSDSPTSWIDDDDLQVSLMYEEPEPEPVVELPIVRSAEPIDIDSIVRNIERNAYNAIQYQPFMPSAMTGNVPRARRHTRALREALASEDDYEPVKESIIREYIVDQIREIFSNWVFMKLRARDLIATEDDTPRCQVHPFGSYRLNVHQRSSDLDILCIAPMHISREDCLKSFIEMMVKSPNLTIYNVQSIREAYVPIVKMKIFNVYVDLLFCIMDRDDVPYSLDFNDPMLRSNLDDRSLLGLNGHRVSEEILRLVRHNSENFSLALRVIRTWAKRNGVYGAKLGYVSGVSWAIMMAKINMENPGADAVTLIVEFFNYYTRWEWPRPVTLNPIRNINRYYKYAWNPEYNMTDRDALMPVITPVTPEQNSNRTISRSSKIVIDKALLKGRYVVRQIMENRESWRKLFEPAPFFGVYNHYLALFVTCIKSGDHKHWCKYVESKIRYLVGTLERRDDIILAHVYPEVLSYPNSSIWFIGLKFISDGSPFHVSLTDKVNDFIRRTLACSNIYTGKNLSVKYLSKNQCYNYISSYYYNKLVI